MKGTKILAAAMGVLILSAAGSAGAGDEARRIPIRAKGDGLIVWAEVSGSHRESVRPFVAVSAHPGPEAALPAAGDRARAGGIAADAKPAGRATAASRTATQAVDALFSAASGKASLVETATFLGRLKSRARHADRMPAAAVAREDSARGDQPEASFPAAPTTPSLAPGTWQPEDRPGPPDKPTASGARREEHGIDRTETCESCSFQRSLN